jgi:hypothetical protein
LRTWDDALDSSDIIEKGGTAASKVEYATLTPERRRAFNGRYLARLFPGDPQAQRRHALALNASADRRNLHKGAFGEIAALRGNDVGKMSTAEKKRHVFGSLCEVLRPARFKPETTPPAELDSIVAKVEHQHRVLCEEFCLHAIHAVADETLGLIFALDGRDTGWIDPDKVRHVVQGPLVPPTPIEPHDAEWQKTKGNLSEGARQTLMYAFCDLGKVEGGKLRDKLKEQRPAVADAIDSLWDHRRENERRGIWVNRGDCMRL